MTNAEKNDPAVQARLKELYAKYKEKKYTVAVFHSGGGDLYQSTLDLLTYNKRKCAELAAQRQQQVLNDMVRWGFLTRAEAEAIVP